MIKEFENLSYEGYAKKRSKHEPTDSYFYLARHIPKCTMRQDPFNLHVYYVGTETTSMQWITILHFCSLGESKSKGITTDENLLQVYSTDKNES